MDAFFCPVNFFKNAYEITEQPAKSMKNKMFTALCMVAAGLLEDGSSTMYVAAANPLEEAALGRLNPNRRWQQTKRIASALL